MRKHRLLIKFVAVLLLLQLMSGAFAGCSTPDDRATVEKLLTYLQNAEYPRIYQLLTSKARSSISLVGLSEKYSDIYSSIGVKKVACKLTAIESTDSENETAIFSMAVTADKLGAFTLNMQAPLCLEDGHWLIDWSGDLVLPGMGDNGSVQLTTEPASRGEIFDSTGEVLAGNDHALSVYVDTSNVQNYETLIRLLAPKLGMTEMDLRAKLAPAIRNAPGESQEDSDTVPPQAEGVSETGNPSATPPPATPTPSLSPSPSASPAATPQPRSYVVKAYPKGSLTYDQQQDLLKIPGVGIDDSWMTVIRNYPFGDMLAQTLGYTGVMSAEDIAKPENAGLPKDAIIGQTGLESAFEQQLRGQPGYRLIVSDGKGNSATLVQKQGTDGRDLRLTIDVKLQQTAEMLLRQYLTPEMAGSIIVMDPKTGYIQAMASAPSFDPNMFSFPVSSDVMKAMNDPSAMHPFTNRPTSGLYAPGSTIKPFTAFMGLTDKVISAGSVFPYANSIVNDYWQPSDWSGTPIKRKEATEGAMNLQNCMTASDNIYFAWVAMKVGADSFYQHCLDLGIGLDAQNRMKFDLPLAASQISNTGKIIGIRQLADSGYGQGEFKITPLQMSALFGSIGNDGDIMQPRIVASINHDDGPHYVADITNPPQVWKQAVIPKNILNILIPDLKRVAQIGTAKGLHNSKLDPYEICAKTGTAEIGDDKTREISWLIGFTTKKMDRLVCVTLEVPADDMSVRINIAKAMFEAEGSRTAADDAADNNAAKN